MKTTPHSPLGAILFDLDGTLLENDMEVFLPHYFRRLSSWVSHLVPPERFLLALQRGVEAMLANEGRATNEEVFAATFFPLAGRRREELGPVFLDFYRRDFPQLQAHTRRRPEAQAVVQAALDQGCEVVIATNPLFPAIAIEQRLEWAGVAGLPYRLVTSYENSRACKPNLLYFRQVLEAIGRAPEECLMVGDEDMDMVAGRLGIRTFLVGQPPKPLAPETPEPTARGTLAEVAEWIRAG